MAFKLSIVADIRDWLKGTRNMGEALDDVSDSLDDLGRDSDDSARKIERSFEDAGDKIADVGDGAKDAGKDIERHVEDARKEVDDQTEKMERSFRDAFEAAAKSSKEAGDDIGRNTNAGLDKAGEGMAEFKDEAVGTAREGAASFTGEFDDVADIIQETLANSLAGFGPAGMAAGIAMAAGAGYFYNEWNKQAEATEERISAMYEDMLESGNRYLSANYVNSEIGKIFSDAEDAVISYADAQKVAAATGLDLSTVIRGYAGDAESAGAVAEGLGTAISGFNDRGATAWRNQGQELDILRGKLTGQDALVAQAAERSEGYRQTILSTAEAQREWASATAEMDAATADATTAIAENAEAIADSSQRGEANRAVLADLVDGYLDIQSAGRDAGASTEELTGLQAEQYDAFISTARAAGIGEDAAHALAVQYGLVPEDVATDFRAYGTDGARRAAQGTRDEYNKIPRDISTNVRVNMPSQSDLQARLNARIWGLTAPPITVRVRYGQNIA